MLQMYSSIYNCKNPSSKQTHKTTRDQQTSGINHVSCSSHVLWNPITQKTIPKSQVKDKPPKHKKISWNAIHTEMGSIHKPNPT
jgi:hypothetical protein